MKFLVFTDLHEDRRALEGLLRRAKEDDVEFVVCCGDFSTFGRGAKEVLKKFSALGKTFYVIPGNHEEGGDFEELVAKYKHCVSLDRKAISRDDFVLLGFGGGGFALQDPEFRKIARTWYGNYKDRKTILVTHQPPFGTKLDLLEMGHVGNKDFTKFIKRMKPKLAISGHLHETVGEIDKLGDTKLINPGWEGMVVEVK